MTISIGRFETDADIPAGLGSGMAEDTSYRQRGIYRQGVKRLLDILVVVLAAPFVVPLVALMALVVAFDGGKPFYTQDRIGKGGRVFRMWKLRSMVVDADARMVAHLAANPEARREWDETQKLRNDPRITRFGQFLRKSSMDELPQLWNVLTGDMSLVGPRPMMPCQAGLYPSDAYYHLRPGITGYWQTAGRNRTTFAARAHFDAAYERELSLATDLAILARTVQVVLKGTGC
ncbi:MAG: sugar transferase [Gemmobacter sp.]|uniref:sugar transferase n=1 Tax=Gemmobacter sp. TaxID=1898957 RepID=UPI003919FCEE